MKPLKTTVFSLLTVSTLALTACATADKTISYKEAHHYFVRNDVTDFSPRIIRNQTELEHYFGMAPVMSNDGSGLPTDIDFGRKNAIAIIEQQTNTETDIRITSIAKGKDGQMTVRYKVVRSGAPQSYSFVPFALVLVDKKHGDNVTFVKE